MNDTDLSPEQASELLEQAQEQVEAGWMRLNKPQPKSQPVSKNRLLANWTM